MDWTDESILLLRQLWDEGLSTAEIGRRMQITKNAVVGKAHRLDLPARPSPIRKMLDAAVGAAPGAVPAVVAEARAPAAGMVTRRAETALESGTVPAALAPPRRAEVVALPGNGEAGRTTAGSSGGGVAGPGGTVHVLRPAMAPVAPRSAEPDAIPDAALERLVAAERAEPDPEPERRVPATAAARQAVSVSADTNPVTGTAPRRRGLSCCWPLGEPGTKDFHFCGADPVQGKPYCAEHAALAYVKVRDRRDSVA